LKFVINIQWRLLASGAKRRDEQLRASVNRLATFRTWQLSK
jgi:hypothetical protein